MRGIKRIAILGIGGVGGYYGGKLAAHYGSSADMEIIFIARGENERVIREKGMLLITPAGEEIIHPDIVSHNPAAIGEVDLLICAIKAYDLEEGLQHVVSCINQHTIILPLLNGVNNLQRIQQIVPWANCWQGCTYIVTRLSTAGVVTETGIWNQLYLGSETATEESMQNVVSIFTAAGINAKGLKEITPVLWTKFIFLSPLATLTTSLNLPVGAILENETHKNMLQQLIEEIATVALSKQIKLPDSIIADTLEKITKLPYTTFSSMHHDFSRGSKTEVDSLTGYVVSLGKQLGIPTPVHEQVLARLIIG